MVYEDRFADRCVMFLLLLSFAFLVTSPYVRSSSLSYLVPNFPLARLRPTHSVYIGLRDVDAAEKRILRENDIKCFTMHDVDKHGIGKVVEMALAHVNPRGERPVHLSFDVDATDPSVAASESTCETRRDGTARFRPRARVALPSPINILPKP